MVEEFFADIDGYGGCGIDRDDLATIKNWDHSGEYPEGNPNRKREYSATWCSCDGKRWNRENQSPDPSCQDCHGSGVARKWIKGPLVCNVISENEEHWMPNYWDTENESRWDARRDRWCGPPSSCIRAGLDMAVAPSGGVVGFTAGDIRRMYHEGVPDWIARHWDEAETIEVKAVVPGVGFVPKVVGKSPRFEDMADTAGVWL